MGLFGKDKPTGENPEKKDEKNKESFIHKAVNLVKDIVPRGENDAANKEPEEKLNKKTKIKPNIKQKKETITVENEEKDKKTKFTYDPNTKVLTILWNDIDFSDTLQAGSSIDINLVVEIRGDKLKTIKSGAFFGFKNLKKVYFPNVTEIGERAFGLSGLEEINSDDFPKVTSIKGNAFNGLTNLKKVSLKNIISIDKEAFLGCTNLNEISFPNVETIGEGAFKGCGLTKIDSSNIPKVNIIEKSVFEDCEKLTNVDLPKVTKISEGAFKNASLGDINLPKVKIIEREAFEQCLITEITNETFQQVETLDLAAFKNCKCLKSIILSYGIENLIIGDSAFEGCDKLVEISIAGLKTIEKEALKSGKNLTTVSFPDATTIKEEAFTELSNLINVNIPKINTIEKSAFKGCGNLFTIGTERQNNDEPKIATINATTIGEGAFSGCNLLEIVKCPNAISIGNNAFEGCIDMMEIHIPKATSIGSSAFSGCLKLSAINLHSVKAIQNLAFSACNNLAIINLHDISSIGSNIFSGCTELYKVILSENSKINPWDIYHILDKNQKKKVNIIKGEKQWYHSLKSKAKIKISKLFLDKAEKALRKMIEKNIESM